MKLLNLDAFINESSDVFKLAAQNAQTKAKEWIAERPMAELKAEYTKYVSASNAVYSLENKTIPALKVKFKEAQKTLDDSDPKLDKMDAEIEGKEKMLFQLKRYLAPLDMFWDKKNKKK